MEYLETQLVLVSAAVILAVSLDLMMGVGGLFSAASGVFYGIGAYVAALTWVHLSTNLLLAVLLALVVGGVLAVPFVVPALRSHREVTFVVASLAFATIIGEVFASWTSVTGGEAGLVGFPIATLGSLSLGPGPSLTAVSIVLAALVVVIKQLISRSTWGLDLRATRDNQSAARALGVHTARLQTQSAVLACALAAVAGVLYAAQVGFVNPDGFDVNESELIAAMVVLGGMSTFLGPILGAIVLTAIPAALTFAPISASSLGLDEQLAYGVLLVVLMVVRPEGLVGRLTRIQARLHTRPRQLWRTRAGVKA